MAVTIIIEYDFNQAAQHLLSCILEQFGKKLIAFDILAFGCHLLPGVPGNRL